MSNLDHFFEEEEDLELTIDQFTDKFTHSLYELGHEDSRMYKLIKKNLAGESFLDEFKKGTRVHKSQFNFSS